MWQKYKNWLEKWEQKEINFLLMTVFFVDIIFEAIMIIIKGVHGV